MGSCLVVSINTVQQKQEVNTGVNISNFSGSNPNPSENKEGSKPNFGKGKSYPIINARHSKQIEGAKRKLRVLISEKGMAGLMLRLAQNSAATFDQKSRTGGPFGTMRLAKELNREENKGLEVAVKLLGPLKKEFGLISHADLYQLAGIVALEITGGPEVAFHAGRKDMKSPPGKGRIPNWDLGADHLRKVFRLQMGLGDRDIVALFGGRVLEKNLGTEPASPNVVFNNSYYRELLEGEKTGAIELPSERALLDDPIFLHYVDLYAKDEEVFFEDFAEAHLKLSELGFADV